jgi:hypothetical protein
MRASGFTSRAPVGLVEREVMSDFLYRWQALCGALLGGGLGFGAAYLVATMARWHDRRAAGHFVVGQLDAFRIFSESMSSLQSRLRERIDQLPPNLKQTRVDHDLRLRFVLDSVRIRPKVTQLFQEAISKLMDVDEFLTAHLQSFLHAAEAADRLLEDEEHKLYGKREHYKEQYERGTKLVVTAFEFRDYKPKLLYIAVGHANEAKKLIRELILSSHAYHNRLQRRFDLCDQQFEQEKKVLDSVGD